MATEDKILYRCTLCQPGEEYTNDNAGDVKKHITTSDNGRHEGKQSDMQFIEEVDKLDKESVEANERTRHEGEERTIVENNTGSYEGPATGLDMTGQHITERDKKKAEEIVGQRANKCRYDTNNGIQNNQNGGRKYRTRTVRQNSRKWRMSDEYPEVYSRKGNGENYIIIIYRAEYYKKRFTVPTDEKAVDHIVEKLPEMFENEKEARQEDE